MDSAGAANADAGHSNIPIASERNEKSARERIRKQLNDILYPGALTSRQKRYAAEPAPFRANLPLMCERSANGGEIRRGGLLLPERIGQLSDNLGRKRRLVIDAIMLGQLFFGHTE